MVYLEREKGAKPSTLRDYRWLLAEPGQAHRRGGGASPGVMMDALGARAVRDLTTRDVAEYLRSLDKAGASARTVNKHRQVISAVFSFGMREDTYRLPANPVAATNKRREPPAAVLDFYEPEEVEAIARAAAAGAHRNVTKLKLDEPERGARVQEDRQDAELIRIAAYTGLRLGELLALRWDDVDLIDRRLLVHRAFSDRVEGPTKSWQARFLPIADAAAKAFARLAEHREFTSPTTTCSATVSDVHSMARRCAGGSRRLRRPPAYASSASTLSATAPARSSLARRNHAGSRASSVTPS